MAKNSEKTDRFSVSLVYQDYKTSMLRALITNATSQEEALGIAITYFEAETKGLALALKCVIKIKP